MKYTCEVEIELPRKRVVELFEDPENLPHWQTGFVSIEHASGAPGANGSISYLKYKMGKRDVEMTEIIVSNKLPDEFKVQYDAKGVHNKMENFFLDLGEGRTRWVTHNIFEFKGFMKLVAFFMPGAFRKATQKTLEDFKGFAESKS